MNATPRRADALAPRRGMEASRSAQIRPIEPCDAGLLEDFGAHLSNRSRYQRFFSPRGFLPGEVERLTQIDAQREVALIATVEHSGHKQMAGVARYVADAAGVSCEMAIVIADSWQGQGLGRQLLGLLIEQARAHGIKRIEAMVLAENLGMQRLAVGLGFNLHRVAGDGLVLQISKSLEARH